MVYDLLSQIIDYYLLCNLSATEVLSIRKTDRTLFVDQLQRDEDGKREIDRDGKRETGSDRERHSKVSLTLFLSFHTSPCVVFFPLSPYFLLI